MKTHKPSVDLQDASNWASGIVNAAINMHAGKLMTGQARALWDDMGEFGARYALDTHIGYIKALDALIASPEATQVVLQRVRNRLLKEDPGLAAYGKASPEHPPLGQSVAPSPHYLKVLEILERGEFPPAELFDRLVVHDQVVSYIRWRIVDWVVWRQKTGRPLARNANDDTFPIEYEAARSLALEEFNRRWEAKERLREAERDLRIAERRAGK